MKFLSILATVFLAIFIISGSAVAMQYTFSDYYANWPGADFPVGWDDKDVNGTPIISSLEVNVNDDFNYLESIVIYMIGLQTPDALFINNDGGGWDEWDYYVYRDKDSAIFYQVADDYGYTYSVVPDDGQLTRVGHINGIESGISPASGYLDGVVWNGSALTYTFAADMILMSDSWAIGYTPWCANDVALASPVPEPTSMLLLGAGLLGIAGAGRKRLTRRS